MTALNEFKLKAGFKREFGMTIFEYLRRLRMEKAIRLFEEADAAIPEIAERVGYRTLHGFSQTFSRY